jgi:hypothetical protein
MMTQLHMCTAAAALKVHVRQEGVRTASGTHGKHVHAGEHRALLNGGSFPPTTLVRGSPTRRAAIAMAF